MAWTGDDLRRRRKDVLGLTQAEAGARCRPPRSQGFIASLEGLGPEEIPPGSVAALKPLFRGEDVPVTYGTCALCGDEFEMTHGSQTYCEDHRDPADRRAAARGSEIDCDGFRRRGRGAGRPAMDELCRCGRRYEDHVAPADRPVRRRAQADCEGFRRRGKGAGRPAMDEVCQCGRRYEDHR